MKRIKFLDITRAFAIIFIVIGHTLVHSANCSIIFKFLYSFHVVLFFIISGYTFKVKDNENIFNFIKNKFIRIMVPYFIWALLFLIPYMLFGQGVGGDLGTSSSFNLIDQIINVLYGNGNLSALKQNSSLWFLPALFSMNLFYYFVVKFSDKYKMNKELMLVILFIIGFISSSFLSVFLPWGINTVLNVGVFFYIGYLFREVGLLNSNKLFKLKYILIVLLIGLVSCFANDLVSCIDYSYGNYFLCFLSGLCLSLVVLYISYKIDKNKILEYIGKNTMGILIFHKLIVLVFQTKLGVISNLLRDSNIIVEVLLTLIVTALSIGCSLIATEVCRKILPIVIGEKRVNK